MLKIDSNKSQTNHVSALELVDKFYRQNNDVNKCDKVIFTNNNLASFKKSFMYYNA